MRVSSDSQVIADAIAKDYLLVRVLDDGSVCALGDLLYTRAIHVNCDLWGYESRFCFEDRGLALLRFVEMKTADDEPEGFIARR